jgi:hypothetical protein
MMQCNIHRALSFRCKDLFHPRQSISGFQPQVTVADDAPATPAKCSGKAHRCLIQLHRPARCFNGFPSNTLVFRDNLRTNQQD